jgi:hypothetical protein
MMRRTVMMFGLAATVVGSSLAWGFELTPATQKEIDTRIEMVKSWAADPIIVKAVAAQNARGPIPEMDNAKWKTVRRTDPIVKAFQSGEAGQFLKSKVAASNDIVAEAFLSAARGEKVAFIEKTTSYIHKGMPKFDVPFDGGKPWQGKAEFDESTQLHQIQVSVPVLAGGKAIGVLVVGLNVTKLARLVQN